MTKTETDLFKLISPIVESEGYSLYDIEYFKESSEWFLRLYIDKPSGKVDLDDCEKISNLVSDFLDEKDPISTSYNLEVSSCGLERNLREHKHYEIAINQKIHVKLYKSLNNKKELMGILKSLSDSAIVIETEDGDIQVPFEDIASANTVYDFDF